MLDDFLKNHRKTNRFWTHTWNSWASL